MTGGYFLFSASCCFFLNDGVEVKGLVFAAVFSCYCISLLILEFCYCILRKFCFSPELRVIIMIFEVKNVVY